MMNYFKSVLLISLAQRAERVSERERSGADKVIRSLQKF